MHRNVSIYVALAGEFSICYVEIIIAHVEEPESKSPFQAVSDKPTVKVLPEDVSDSSSTPDPNSYCGMYRPNAQLLPIYGEFFVGELSWSPYHNIRLPEGH
jgi:hypothetical protein